MSVRAPGHSVALVLCALALPGCETLPQNPLSALEAAVTLPRTQTSWMDQGRRLLEQGRPEQAHDAFLRALRDEGVTASALTGAGVAAARQGLLTEARRRFEQAVAIDPGSVVAHNNLGAILYELGEVEAARQAFRTAFAASSGTSGQAARNLGIAELAIRRAEAAEPQTAASGMTIQRVGVAEYRLLQGSDDREHGQG